MSPRSASSAHGTLRSRFALLPTTSATRPNAATIAAIDNQNPKRSRNRLERRIATTSIHCALSAAFPTCHGLSEPRSTSMGTGASAAPAALTGGGRCYIWRGAAVDTVVTEAVPDRVAAGPSRIEAHHCDPQSRLHGDGQHGRWLHRYRPPLDRARDLVKESASCGDRQPQVCPLSAQVDPWIVVGVRSRPFAPLKEGQANPTQKPALVVMQLPRELCHEQ